MKTLIKQLLENKLLGEAAIRITDLPDTTALFIKESRFGDVLILYDVKTNKALGIISIYNFGANLYEFTHVAAVKGFGPLIYELGMMLSATKGGYLFPSRDGDIRSGAWSVWERFYKRADIKKYVLRPLGKYYTFNILGDNYEFDDITEFNEIINSLTPDEHNAVILFNTGVRINNTTPLTDLKERGDGFIKKGFDVNIAYNAGDELWYEKYD